MLIDGAPDLMKAMIEQYLPSQTQEELQNNILLYIMDNLQPAASGKVVVIVLKYFHPSPYLHVLLTFLSILQLILDLDNCTTWEQKLDSFVSHLASADISLSIENQKALCTTLYNRVLALQKYDALSLPRIRAPITLLKPTQSSTYMAEADYGLRKVMFS